MFVKHFLISLFIIAIIGMGYCVKLIVELSVTKKKLIVLLIKIVKNF